MSYAQDSTAQDVLQQSRNFYYGLDDMTVDFTYYVEGVSSRLRIQKGTLAIKKSRYKLLLEDQETYCDSQRIWVYLPLSNEYMQFGIGDWTYGNIMQLVYSMYFFQSDVSYVGEERLKDGSLTHKLRFKMFEPSLNFTTAYAWYDTRTKLLSRVTFLDRKKRQRSYSFYNLRYNSNLENDYFVFRPEDHPGIEMRR